MVIDTIRLSSLSFCETAETSFVQLPWILQLREN